GRAMEGWRAGRESAALATAPTHARGRVAGVDAAELPSPIRTLPSAQALHLIHPPLASRATGSRAAARAEVALADTAGREFHPAPRAVLSSVGAILPGFVR